MEPVLGRHVLSKVQRWALYLSRFAYIIEHVRGDENVFADILTRWTKGYRRERKSVHSLLLESAEQLIPVPEDFIWPDIEVIRASQKTAFEPTGNIN